MTLVRVWNDHVCCEYRVW